MTVHKSQIESYDMPSGTTVYVHYGSTSGKISLDFDHKTYSFSVQLDKAEAKEVAKLLDKVLSGEDS